jgi:8-amino-7-oxononanoate synthase
MRHPSATLPPWSSITVGKPAALEESEPALDVARGLAALQGCEAALLGPSTLHWFVDLPAALAAPGAAVLLDGALYPIARWGAERAQARGATLIRTPHYDPDTLQRLLRQHQLREPVFVANGVCPGCGRAAPVPELLAAMRPWGGRLVLDDTQALGILGHGATAQHPYGWGGGGSLRWHGVNAPEVILVSSLAKAFGAPLAALSGSRDMVEWLRDRSETRVHCSPPSVPAVLAAQEALRHNRSHGDALRRRLAALVQRLRAGLSDIGVTAVGGLLPVQTLALEGPTAQRVHAELLTRGVRTVLVSGTCREPGPRVTLLLSVRHRPEDIDRVVHEISVLQLDR